MPLGERIKALRTERGWSQGKIAQQIETNGRQISRYENDHITLGRDPDQAPRGLRRLDRLPAARQCSLTAPRLEDREFVERLECVQRLSEEDRSSLHGILDALLAKNRIKSFAQGLG